MDSITVIAPSENTKIFFYLRAACIEAMFNCRATALLENEFLVIRFQSFIRFQFFKIFVPFSSFWIIKSSFKEISCAHRSLQGVSCNFPFLTECVIVEWPLEAEFPLSQVMK